MESHAADQMMEHNNGIGNFAEDYIEQGHQFGMQEERQTNGLHGRGKAANSHSKWETMRLHPLVENITSETIEGTKRRCLLVDDNGRTPRMVRDESRRAETATFELHFVMKIVLHLMFSLPQTNTQS